MKNGVNKRIEKRVRFGEKRNERDEMQGEEVIKEAKVKQVIEKFFVVDITSMDLLLKSVGAGVRFHNCPD
ncbi:unnamed protein product [Enterobius vermicularis]|uniref:Uncharacterized protein n=1 Tax=Enterobius vermicularis TaxID=51028 RepID=A0A0N4VHW1_ENTVE|nr:unnamed protein product [Enterobius vermicularis]